LFRMPSCYFVDRLVFDSFLSPAALTCALGGDAR